MSAAPPAARLGALARRYWLESPAPLGGFERGFLFLGLFAAAVVSASSPLRGWMAYRDFAPEWLGRDGLAVGLSSIPVEVGLLRALSAVLVVVWLAAAFGLVTRVAIVGAALLAIALHGLTLPALEHPGAWLLPLWAMVAMAASRSSDRWALDHRWRPVDPPAADLSSSGLPRRMILVAVVGYELAAGCSKLRDAGLRWADGETLASALPDKAWLGAHPTLLLVLSVVALVVQVGAPLALLSRAARALLAPAWLAVHLGDLALLGGDELGNAVVVALVVFGRAPRREAPRDGRPQPLSPHPARSARLGIGLAATWSIALLAMGPLGLGRWPFARPDHRSAYVGHDLVGGVWAEEILRLDRVPEVAKACRDEPCHGVILDRLAGRFSLRLRGYKRRDKLVLERGLGVASPALWRRLLAPVIVADLAEREGWPRRVEGSPGEVFLKATFPIILREVASPESFRRVELIYRHGKGKVAVSALDLPFSSPRADPRPASGRQRKTRRSSRKSDR